MMLQIHDALFPLAVLNVIAAAVVMLFGRRRSTVPEIGREAEVEGAALDQRAERQLDATFHQLVEEVNRIEASTRFRTRGEERLARDVARWRKGAVGGESLPPGAGSGRVGRPPRRRAVPHRAVAGA